MSVLHHDEIAARLLAMPGWHHRGNALEKHYDCANFDGSIRFINAIAALANAHDHHPDLAISWNDVGVTLSSHDAGGITTRDFRLAAAIDALTS
ncbi:MAG: 4a-hydroxytetrahydrobiopterin dehydratase [Vulcanimicrobiaceae bacterium]